MNDLYQTTVHDRKHFEVLAPTGLAAVTLVEKLSQKLDLKRTYEMSGVLRRTARVYHEPIDNRPAVDVEVSRKRGEGSTLFKFSGHDIHPEDIIEIARVLGVELKQDRGQ